MKKYSRVLIMVLALLIGIPMIWNHSTVIASAAASPAFVKTKVELVGVGKTYQLEIKDKVAGSTYKYTSSDKNVATVSSKGKITAVAGGTAKVQCKITYSNKKTKTLSCSVTVKIPAEEIRISNAVLVNGAHRMNLGSTMDFNATTVPSKPTDKAYWYADKGDTDCISVDNAAEGIVTARKVGKVTLRVKAAASSTAADAKKSNVDDYIIIEVVDSKASVQSAEIVNTTEIKVVFDSAVNPSTVIETGNKLSSNIDVVQRKNAKGVLAADPGTLTAVLSADGRTLVITASKTFDGDYGISLSNKILTTSGVPIEAYYKSVSFVDNYPPSLMGSPVLDDSGFRNTINFTEPIDFTNLSVTGATVIGSSSGSAGANASAYTLSILNNRLNYVASENKKSLVIDLSNIDPADYGKIFTVVLAGVKDMAGNAPASYTLMATLRTDSTAKAQAVPISVVRTGYNTLKATFTRSLSYAGFLQVNNGSMMEGVIDASDPKNVVYTINETDAALSGTVEIRLSLWDSYNVKPTDTAALTGWTRKINFTVDKSNPVLISYEFDATTSTLALTYNKEVTTALASGVITTTLTTITDDIRSGTNINYTRMDNSNDKKTINLKLSNVSALGTYSFILENGFVVDSYKNPSLARPISFNNTKGNSSSELPAPYEITQSDTNLSQISIQFANKLDKASAELVGNYTIPGVPVLSATLTRNTPDGATVLLTVADGGIDATVERPVKISGVKGYNGSYSAMTEFTMMVPLKDNKKPTMVGSPVFDRNTLTGIQLNFSEEITGQLTLRISNISNSAITYGNTVTVSGNTAYISLDYIPDKGTGLKIEVLNNSLIDANGNKAVMNSTMFVTVLY